jgi:hypothetical protein
MKTVLIITASFDPQADLLIAELRRRSVPCVRWNTYEFPLSSLLTYRASNIWRRNHIGRADHRSRFDRQHLVAVGPARRIPGRTQSRRAALRRTRSRARGKRAAGDRQVRLDQPSDMRAAGQLQGRSVVRSPPDEVRAFIAAAPAQIVYKASSPPRNIAPDKALFTGLVTDETLANLDLIRITPGIFQERIDKSYELRITVIGARTFAVKIDSQALAETQLDWRHAQHDVAYEPVTLPREIATKITAFMEHLGLVYGAFDFIVTPDSRYVFLEVNPGGAYMWVEAATGLGITPALADALIEPCRS